MTALGVPPERVMLVRAEISGGHGVSVGAGTLVGPRFILTAAHVVFDDDGKPLSELSAGPPEVEKLSTARVVWPSRWQEGQPTDHDAALVEITDAGWVPPRIGFVRWGRLTGRAGGVGCEATGFPRVLRDPNGVRDSDHMTGSINPGSRRVAGRYDINVTSAVPSLPVDQRAPSQWSGMSGAGVFVNSILIGVLIIDEPGYPSTRLSALPVHCLHNDPGFRDVVMTFVGGDGRAELVSVELDPMLAPAWPRRRRRVSPATLLRADAEVVPFRSRSSELDELIDWCNSADDLDFRLLVGPGGRGKTRLGRELVHRCADDRWTVGFLIPDQRGQPVDLTAIVDTAGPLLLIIDYAETRTEQVARLLVKLRQAPEIARIRVLLLARSAGRWWDRLRRHNTDVLDVASVFDLPTLDDSFESRQQAFDAAVAAFAGALPGADASIDWQGIADSVDIPDDLDADRYGTPLTLQMTALLTLLAGAPSQPVADVAGRRRARPLELRILDHEQGYWEDSAADYDLDLHSTTLSTIVAASALLGASDQEEALASLAQLPDLKGQPVDRRRAVDDWLHDLYPGTPGQHWGPLQPDRIAEHLVGSHIAINPTLLGTLLAEATDGQVVRALTLLWRALPHQPHVARQVRELLERDPTRLGPIAVAITAAASNRFLSGRQEVSKIYSNVSIEERRAILEQWLGPNEVIL